MQVAFKNLRLKMKFQANPIQIKWREYFAKPNIMICYFLVTFGELIFFMLYKSSEIGKMLKEARLKRKLTQEELASRLKKNRSYISRIENDGTSINLKTLQEIVETGLGGKIKIEL